MALSVRAGTPADPAPQLSAGEGDVPMCLRQVRCIMNGMSQDRQNSVP